MTKILFVCAANRSRSRTAERIYANHPGLEVKSAGVDFLEAQTPVSEELLQWADVILRMEKRHQKEIENDYAACIEGKVIDSLGVGRFIYSGMNEMIKEKVYNWLKINDLKISKFENVVFVNENLTLKTEVENE